MQPERAALDGPGSLFAPHALLRRWPHLPAFWPGRALRPPPPLPGAHDLLALEVGAPVPAGWPGRVLRLDAGPFAPPRFGQRIVPPVLFAAESDDPVAAALPAPPDTAARDRAAALRPLLRAARAGGPPGLPDPGPAALGCAPGEAVLFLDPCDPGRAEAAAALAEAARGRGGRLLAIRDPAMPPAARPLLAGTIDRRVSPWTLIDAAAEIHALPGPTARLAALAGVPVRGPGSVTDGLGLLAALAGAARCADPVRAIPCTMEDALGLLAEWRRQEEANRGIAVCLGMAFWKRRRMAAALASAAGVPAFARSTGAALAEAARRGGGVAVWASRAPADLEPRARAAGVPVVWVEDGFVRSAGLGAGFLPAASISLDARRPYYDPAGPSDLEVMLATAAVPPALRARAAALRAALVARGVTKYNLRGAAPRLPATPGRRRILVPGQVEDDLSVLRGAAPPVAGNLDLLRAVRALHPDAFIAFKPHPDVEAGYRRGAVPEAEAKTLADLVLAGAPMAPLLDQVEEVHTITSLTGFEALLRGRAVTCWGRPFYAGWGLTLDRAPIPRRVRRLDLEELVAIALILFPRYLDPVTELPCPPEALLERLDQDSAWRGGALARLRRWQGRAMARLLPGRRA